MSNSEPLRRTPICILGAGPQALTLAAALLESQPYSLDDTAALAAKMEARHLANQQGPACQVDDILVVDPAGGWLTGWEQAFAFYEIPTLRSPMLAHPDPRLELALWEASSADLGHDPERRRENKRVGLAPVDLGEWNAQIWRKEKRKVLARKKECTAHVRNSDGGRGPPSIHIKHFLEEKAFLYARPPTGAFKRLCEGLVRRYRLENKVMTGKAIALIQAEDGSNDVLVELQDGRRLRAGRVVCCLGPNGGPRIPVWAEPFLRRGMEVGGGGAEMADRGEGDKSKAKEDHPCTPAPPVDKAPRRPTLPSLLHASDLLTLGLLSPRALYRNQHVLIVGGGLTSAHLVLSAHRHGAKSIILCTRGSFRVQEFCVDLAWVGRARHLLLSHYRNQPIEARYRTLRQARPGGSITPVVMRELQRLLTQGNIPVVLYEHTEVTHLLPLPSPVPSSPPFCVSLSNNVVLPHVDRLLLATGICVDVTKDPLLFPFLRPETSSAKKGGGREAGPGVLTTYGGLPVVDTSLRLLRDHGEDATPALEQCGARAEVPWERARSEKWARKEEEAGSHHRVMRKEENINVHVMGLYAALHVGPDAGNLTGAMTASRLLADVVRAEGGRKGGREEGRKEGREGGKEKAGKTKQRGGEWNIHALNNPFGILEEEEEEEEEEEVEEEWGAREEREEIN